MTNGNAKADCHADFATSLEVIISAVQLRVVIRLLRALTDDPNESEQSFSKKFSKTSAMPEVSLLLRDTCLHDPLSICLICIGGTGTEQESIDLGPIP